MFLFEPISSTHAFEYYRSDLKPHIYHPLETTPVASVRFGGEIWGKLGLSQPTMEQLRLLVRGMNPVTGARLTARRHGSSDNVKPRVAFYSAVFNVPKSVSLASEIGADHRIRQAIHDAATAELQLIQMDDAGIRVRKQNAPDRNRPRNTASMAWLTLLGNESRELDPHDHIHGLILNVTHDESDQKRPFKALDATRIFQNQKKHTKHFNDSLMAKLRDLGYTIALRPENRAFEIDGISQYLIRLFSKAHVAIKDTSAPRIEQEILREKDAFPAKIEARVAKQIRRKKRLVLQKDLQNHWLSQMDTQEIKAIMQVVERAQQILREQTSSVRPEPTIDILSYSKRAQSVEEIIRAGFEDVDMPM